MTPNFAFDDALAPAFAKWIAPTTLSECRQKYLER